MREVHGFAYQHIRQAELSSVTFLSIPDTQAFVQFGKALGYCLYGPGTTYSLATPTALKP